MNATHFDVFLSHNSRDKPLVERLAVKLKGAGLEPWLDKWHLTPGGRWQVELVDGIRASGACAVFIGPHGWGDWVHEELGVALDRAAKDRAFRLFLVLLPGLPEPFDPTSLPPFLSTRTWVDLRPGIEDSRAFQHLINAIKGVPFGQPLPTEAAAAVCPYRGLQTFDEAQADLFFGRENDIQRLVEKLKGTRFLAVLGPSGSGKSSLVRAGLVPALRKGVLPGSHDWPIGVFTPGAHPLTTLAAQLVLLAPHQAMHTTLDALAADQRTLHLATALALADRPASARAVWVVDQFEEVFTLCQDEAERTAFLENLLYAAALPDGRCVVLLTLRADFYQRCAAYPDLSARLATQQFLVSPMTLEGLCRAIEEPAWQVGLEFEQGLVDTILADIASQPGALPLLEHALLELWERRRGQMLTLEGYRQSGGVQGAIAKRADAIYSRLSAEEQQIARQTLLRLTQPGEGTEDTRRRAALSELVTHGVAIGAVEGVVRELMDARLLTTSEDAGSHEHLVEVAHEALIRGWPRLRGWLDEDRAGLRLQSRLTEAAQEWERLARDESLLYRGVRLAEALEWRSGHEAALNDLERAFLDAGAALKQREEDAEQLRQQHELEAAQRLAASERERAEAAGALARSERRRARVARIFSSGLAVLLVVALVTTGVALQQRSQAQREQRVASQQRDAARAAQQLADQQRSAALAEKRIAEQQRSAAVAAQRVAFSRELAVNATTQLQSDPQLSLLLARAGVEQAPTGEALDALRQALSQPYARAVLHGPNGVEQGALFSHDGTEILSADVDGTARVWDARTGRMLASMQSPRGLIGAYFSADGRTVVTAGPDANARLWDARTGRLLFVLRGHGAAVTAATFSPDGRDVATGDMDGAVRVWDAATGRPLLLLRGHTARIWSVAYSPDGSEIVAAAGGVTNQGNIVDPTARLWNARTGAQIAVLSGHTAPVVDAAFSPNGRRIVTASLDDSAILWDGRTGRLLHVLKSRYGHSNWVVSARFSPDSRLVVTASWDKQAIIWDVATGQPLPTGFLAGHSSKLHSAVFSPSGAYVVTASDDGTARVWAVYGGQQLAVLRGHTGGVDNAVFSPDGSEIVTAGKDGTVRLWDLEIGRVFASIPPAGYGCLAGQPASQNTNYISAIAYSLDGRLVATGSGDCLVRIWDAGTGRPLATLTGHTQTIESIAFSPDGRRLATSSADETVRLWDTRTWHTMAVLRGNQGTVNGVAFSPDGRTLATTSADGTARLWNVSTGQMVRVTQVTAFGLGAVCFSPDGRFLVTTTLGTTNSGGTAIVWSLSTGKTVQTLAGFTSAVNSAAFSPDGHYLAAADYDGLTLVWDTGTWRLVASLRGPESPVQGGIRSLAFSPDGAWLLTGSFDLSVRLWEVADWRNIATLSGQQRSVISVTFSPDGHSILTGGYDSAVRIYPCDACGSTSDLLARANARITRQLTPDERRTYLHESART